MIFVIREIRFSDDFIEKIEYWRTWNVPPSPGISESGTDQQLRSMAQQFHSELKNMNKLLCQINMAAYGTLGPT